MSVEQVATALVQTSPRTAVITIQPLMPAERLRFHKGASVMLTEHSGVETEWQVERVGMPDEYGRAEVHVVQQAPNTWPGGCPDDGAGHISAAVARHSPDAV